MDMKQQTAVRPNQSCVYVLEHNESPVWARVCRGYLPRRGVAHGRVSNPAASLPFTVIGAGQRKIGLQLMATEEC